MKPCIHRHAQPLAASQADARNAFSVAVNFSVVHPSSPLQILRRCALESWPGGESEGMCASPRMSIGMVLVSFHPRSHWRLGWQVQALNSMDFPKVRATTRLFSKGGRDSLQNQTSTLRGPQFGAGFPSCAGCDEVDCNDLFWF